MKKLIIMICAGIILSACNSDFQEEFIENTSNIATEETGKDVPVLEFSNKETFLNTINNDASIETRALYCSGFTSLMDEIRADDPILDSLSYEEKNYVLNNHLTYYDAFGCEDFVPNENFAKILNIDGEVIVNDTIYKISSYGTLYAKAIYRQELQSTFNNINKEDIVFASNEKELQLSPNVKIVDTFNKNQITDEVPHVDFIFEDNISKLDPQPNSSFPPSGTSSSSLNNTPIDKIPFSSFKTYQSGSKTFAGKLWEKIVGERSTKRHEFKKGYRVNGSMYDYDYKVYHECGIFVSMSKKRGGLFKWINGWKDINADELVMNLDDFVLSMNLDIPSPVINQMPKIPQVIGYNNQLNIIGNNIKAVNIMGYDISEETIQKLLGKGLKAGLEYLKRITNKDIDSDINAAQFITPKKIYIIILSDPIYAHNTKKIRKVFGAGANFVISSSVIKNPLSVKSYTELIKLFDKLPKKHIDSGTANLAGRLGNDWGGMNIVKD